MISKFKNKIGSDKHLLELLKGGSVSFVFQIIGIGLSYLFILFVSRLYGAEGMGIFALSFTVLNIFVLFGKFGFDTAMVKFIADNTEENSFAKIKGIYLESLKFLLPLNIFLMTIMFFSAHFIAKYIFKNEDLTISFQIASFALIPLVLRFVHANGLRGMKLIKEYAFLQSIAVYLIGIVTLTLLYFFSNNSFTPILAFTLSVFLSFIISLLLWLKKIEFWINKKTSSLKIKQLLTVSFPMLLASSLMLVIGWTDTIMLGIYGSEKEVGIYNIALKIAVATSIALTAVTSISATKFAHAVKQDNYKELQQVALLSNKLIFYISLPVILLLAIFRVQILNLFGPEFIVGSTALLLLLGGRVFDSMSGTSGYVLQMAGKQNSVKNMMFIAAILNVFLNYLLIPKFGIDGAAIASSLSILFWNILFIIQIKKYFGFLNLPFKWSKKI